MDYRGREGLMVALTDAQKRANEKYLKENYKQVKLSMPIEEATYKSWIYKTSDKG